MIMELFIRATDTGTQVECKNALGDKMQIINEIKKKKKNYKTE